MVCGRRIGGLREKGCSGAVTKRGLYSCCVGACCQ